ncbi:MAG: hypothetical protein AAGF24_05300 [Cyanobacteria bacterium P01_H01_bin.121]
MKALERPVPPTRVYIGAFDQFWWSCEHSTWLQQCKDHILGKYSGSELYDYDANYRTLRRRPRSVYCDRSGDRHHYGTLDSTKHVVYQISDWSFSDYANELEGHLSPRLQRLYGNLADAKDTARRCGWFEPYEPDPQIPYTELVTGTIPALKQRINYWESKENGSPCKVRRRR